MKAALIYDELAPEGERSWVDAEYESPETIQALLAAMEAHCDQVVPVPFCSSLVSDLQREAPDLVFNIAEGREGPSRESIVPAVLDHLRIPYTGSGGVALGISLNKALTKRLAEAAGIPTPDSELFESEEEAWDRGPGLHYPVLLKPNFGGSSVGVSPAGVIDDPVQLPARVGEHVALYDQACLVEHYVCGVDVTVGLLGNGRVAVLPPARIVTPEGMYSAKSKERHDKQIECPCRLPARLEEELVEWSKKIYSLIGARDFARVDYILGEEGRPYFLEINPLPGLSPYYGVYPVLAEAAGYSHTDLIGAIMDLALKRNRRTRCLTHERLAR